MSKCRRTCSEGKFPFCPSRPFLCLIGEVQTRTISEIILLGSQATTELFQEHQTTGSLYMGLLGWGKPLSPRLQWVRAWILETMQVQVSADCFWVCDPRRVMSPCAQKDSRRKRKGLSQRLVCGTCSVNAGCFVVSVPDPLQLRAKPTYIFI